MATAEAGGDSICSDLITLNKTNENEARALAYDATSAGLITLALPLICAAGCLLNAALFFVVYRVRGMRTITNAYLCNLATADILFLFTATVAGSVQFRASPVNFDKYRTGLAGCVLFNFLIHAFFFASIALMTLVSLERYHAICSPLQQWMVSGKARTARLLAVTWLVSAVMAGINVPGYLVLRPLCIEWPDTEEFRDFPGVVADCKPIAPWFTQVSIFSRMVPFFVAMVGNIYMYSRIVLTLNRRFVIKTEDTPTDERTVSHMHSVRRQVSIMLIATGTSFFLCQVSTQIYALLEMVSSITGARFYSPQQRVVFLWVNRMLLYTNSTINPILYNVTNQRYRCAFKAAILHCKRHANNSRKGSNRFERGTSSQRTRQSSVL